MDKCNPAKLTPVSARSPLTQPTPNGRPACPELVEGSVVGRLIPSLLLIALTLAATWKLTLGQRIIARGDLLLYFYPLRDYASQAIREGRLPLWNPYTFMGAPFLANSQAGFFYPLNIALAWLPVAQQVSYSIVLHLLIATLGMYWLMRRVLGVGRFAGLIGATAFGLGGYLGAQVEHLNQLQVLAWLPWEVGIVGRLSSVEHQTSNAKRDMGQTFLALSLILAMQVFAGHTQSLYICVITLALVAVLHLAQILLSHISARRKDDRADASDNDKDNEVSRMARDDKPRPLITSSLHYLIIPLIAAGTLAIIISAAQLMPTLELSRESYRNGGLPFGEAASFSWRPWIIARTLLPTYGDPLFPEYVAYFGAAGLALALLGALSGDGRPETEDGSPQRVRPPSSVFGLPSSRVLPLALTIIGFILALGVVTPLFNVLYKFMPGYSLFRVQARWLVVFSLGMAMLVGLGAQALQDGLRVRQKRIWLLSWLGLMGLLAAGVWLGARISLDPEYHSLPARKVMWGWVIAAGGVTLVILVLNVWDWLQKPAEAEVGRNQAFRTITALIPIALIAELLIASQFQPYARAADAQALTELRPSTAHLLSTIDQPKSVVGRPSSVVSGRILALSSLIFDPGDHIEQSLIYTHTLNEDELYDRIIATKHKEILSPNLSLYYRLPSVDGYDGGLLPTRRFIEFASQFTPTPKSGALDGRLREFLKAVPDNRWLNEMAVRYIITDKTADVFFDGIYYDTLLSVHPIGQMTLPLRPYTSTSLGLVFSGTQATPGQLLANARILFNDGGMDFEIRAMNQVTQPLWPVQLDWHSPRTPTHISFSNIDPSITLTVRAITNIDNTDHSFLSQLPLFNYRLAVTHSGDVKIYENQNPVSRAVIYEGPETISEQQPTIIEDLPERVVIDVDTDEGRKTKDDPSSSVPRRLLLRDTCYPGWVARVDGVEVPIRCANILFREIDLPPTSTAHQVVFTYEPNSVKWGVFASLVGILIWLGLAITVSIRRK